MGIQCRPRVWKRLCPVEISLSIALILRGSVLIRVMWIWFLLRSGLGLDDFLAFLQAHASRAACLLIKRLAQVHLRGVVIMHSLFASQTTTTTNTLLLLFQQTLAATKILEPRELLQLQLFQPLQLQRLQ